eukprot:TRINITY_DN12369_c0_g1_i1.p1 TRINITY_DN12369_c0_g1~~TRINITY_DN12369_c0_g1_i1.p1  ORF type:complete len:378 (+),score=83.04 TRINITY_DN12369_c0_g1_i1:69-1202(+)
MNFGAVPHNPNKDYEVQGVAPDCISSVQFSPRGAAKPLLLVTAWDKSVKVWEIMHTHQGDPNHVKGAPLQALKGPEHSHDLPPLCGCITRDCRVFTGGCDKMVKCWELQNVGKPPHQVAAHDQPIKSVAYIEEEGFLVTGGWDNLVKFWDLRQAQPAAQLQLQGPLADMDCKTYPMASFLTAREIVVYDMQQKRELRRMEPHHTMKEHMRCIGNFLDVKQNPGFAAGSIEGRVCVMYMNDSRDPKDSKNFSFKCHRENNSSDIFAVNSIAFHPGFGTFATVGSNGNYSFWDKDAKQRLKQFNNCDQPIPCCSFNGDGTIFGYAVSYDWTKGAENYNPQKGHHVLLHVVEEMEVKNKPPKFIPKSAAERARAAAVGTK